MSKPVRKFSRLNTNMFLHLECSNVYRLRPMSLAGTPENPGSGISPNPTGSLVVVPARRATTGQNQRRG
jgi:hypothetical protein